jgi:ABC-type dipeptide/oligopeptide/nickel transport system permease subunit
MAATIQELQITVGEDMRFVFMLQHDRFVEVDKETGELLCDTKLLGFFSSEDKCREAISHYKQQPGFKDHLEGFTFKKVEADIDDYNDIPGTFVNLNPDKCPISEVAEVTYNSTTGKPKDIYCVARGYLTYKHGTDENTYTSAPRFLFGTDDKGHDVFKKSFRGLRTSLILGVCTAAFCFAFGLVWGAISGYFGGMVDLIMERIMEIIGGIPSTILLTLMILKFGNNFFVFVTALCLTGWMGTAGRTRTQFYRFKGREYVLASRTLGSSDIRLIFKHILPNSMGTIITGSVLMITSVIFSEATLAYLNLGLQGTQSFGVMMSDNQTYLQSYPNLVLEPAVIISLLMISFNLFGNGLRDAFNPSLKGSE